MSFCRVVDIQPTYKNCGLPRLVQSGLCRAAVQSFPFRWSFVKCGQNALSKILFHFIPLWNNDIDGTNLGIHRTLVHGPVGQMATQWPQSIHKSVAFSMATGKSFLVLSHRTGSDATATIDT